MNTAPELSANGGTACAGCGARFECGLQAGVERCWCVELPPLTPVPDQSCLCPTCLRAAIGAAQRAPGA